VKSQRGFTLIEILVVVMILGLLISLAAPRIMGRTDEARIVKAKADMKAVEAALNLYRLDSGIYPSTDQGLGALVEKPTVGQEPRNWREDGYLERVPVDPWEREYLYASDGSRYTLQSFGADGEEGGDGVNADIDVGEF
jgi:general secretion pathway protein G